MTENEKNDEKAHALAAYLSAFEDLKHRTAQRERLLGQIRAIADAAGRTPLESDGKNLSISGGAVLHYPTETELAVAVRLENDAKARFSECREKVLRLVDVDALTALIEAGDRRPGP